MYPNPTPALSREQYRTIQAILRTAPRVLAAALAAVLVAGVVLATRPATYQATASVAVLIPTSVTPDQALVTSDTVLAAAASDLASTPGTYPYAGWQQITPAAIEMTLRHEIVVTVSGSDLEITATSASAQESADAANAVASAFVSYAATNLKGLPVALDTAATVPTAPARSLKQIVPWLLAAGTLGGLAAFLWPLAWAYWRAYQWRRRNPDRMTAEMPAIREADQIAADAWHRQDGQR